MPKFLDAHALKGTDEETLRNKKHLQMNLELNTLT
jgi:hypothetical protein